MDVDPLIGKTFTIFDREAGIDRLWRVSSKAEWGDYFYLHCDDLPEPIIRPRALIQTALRHQGVQDVVQTQE